METNERQFIHGLREGRIGLYCIQCGYNLRGLVGNVKVCPECGVENSIPYEAEEYQFASDAEIAGGMSRLRRRIWFYALFSTGGLFLLGLTIASMLISVTDPLITDAFGSLFVLDLVVLPFAAYGYSALKRVIAGKHFSNLFWRSPAVQCKSVVLIIFLVGLGYISYQGNQDCPKDGYPRVAVGLAIGVTTLCAAIGWYCLIRPRVRMSRETYNRELRECCKTWLNKNAFGEMKKRIDWSSVPEDLGGND